MPVIILDEVVPFGFIPMLMESYSMDFSQSRRTPKSSHNILKCVIPAFFEVKQIHLRLVRESHT
jgi:hypothetical protein